MIACPGDFKKKNYPYYEIRIQELEKENKQLRKSVHDYQKVVEKLSENSANATELVVIAKKKLGEIEKILGR